MQTPLSMFDRGLSTLMGPTGGRQNAALGSGRVKRLRRLDATAHVGGTEAANYRAAFLKIDKLGKKTGAGTAAMEGAAYIYRKYRGLRMRRHRAIRAHAAASLYAACRQMEIPITLKDVARAGNERRGMIAKCYRSMLSELGISMPVASPAFCVSRIAAAAGLSVRAERAAAGILRRAAEAGLTVGKNPAVMAATALFVASRSTEKHVMQKDIALAAGISDISIRNNMREIQRHAA